MSTLTSRPHRALDSLCRALHARALRLSLGARLSIFALLALLPALAVALTWAENERANALAEAEFNLHQTLAQIAKVNGVIYDQVAPVLDTLSRLPEVRELDANRCGESLRSIQAGTKHFTGLVLADVEGRIICNARRTSTVSYRGDRLDFRRAIETMRLAVGAYTIGLESREPAIHFGQPVFAPDGKLVGVLSGSLSVHRLNDYLARIPLPPKHTLVLTDADGTVLARQPKAKESIGRPMPKGPALQSIEHLDADRVVRLFASASLGNSTGLTLWLGVDKKDVTRLADVTFYQALSLGVALSIGMAFLIWLASFSLLRNPARRLAHTTRRIARGDFTPSPISVREVGELGELGAALEDMAAKLAAREAALVDSEGRFRSTFENAAVGIGHIALDNQWLRVNDTLCRITGYAREELLAQHADELTYPDDIAEGRAAVRRLLAGEVTHYHRQKRCMHKNGGLVWVAITVSLARKPDGNPDYLILVIEDITERKESEGHTKLLVREINHRAKNLLTVVQAVAQQTAGEVEPKVFAEHLGRRLAGLAASHDLLAKNQWKGVDAGELVRSQLKHFGALMGTRMKFEGGSLRLSASAAQAIGMALHELATNAVKYGALSTPNGNVQIKWDLVANGREPCFTMEWAESGGPPPEPPRHRGFGHTVIVEMAEHTLEGQVWLEYRPSGLVWKLRAPADRVMGRILSQRLHQDSSATLPSKREPCASQKDDWTLAPG